jgi:hypothetical protein
VDKKRTPKKVKLKKKSLRRIDPAEFERVVGGNYTADCPFNHTTNCTIHVQSGANHNQALRARRTR